MRLSKFAVAIGIVIALVLGGGHANAQQAAGFTVSPGQIYFDVTTNSPTRTATLTISNSYNTVLRLNAELQSIDEASARLVPNGPLGGQLADALKLSSTDITIPAKGKYQLEIAVDGTWLTDGGHYASLVLSQHATSGASTGFRSAVAISLFVVKSEHIRTDLRLVGSSFNRLLLAMPTSVMLTLSNSGNTHVIPRASVIVYDGQDIVSKAVVNTESSLLFPGQHATFRAQFATYKRFWLPRRLLVRTMYRIDGSDIQLVKEQWMWHVPVIDVLGLLLLAVAIWKWRKRILQTLGYFRKNIRPKLQRHKKKVVAANSPSKNRRGLGKIAVSGTLHRKKQEHPVGLPLENSRTATPRSIAVITPVTSETTHAPKEVTHITIGDGETKKPARKTAVKKTTVSPKQEATRAAANKTKKPAMKKKPTSTKRTKKITKKS